MECGRSGRRGRLIKMLYDTMTNSRNNAHSTAHPAQHTFPTQTQTPTQPPRGAAAIPTTTNPSPPPRRVGDRSGQALRKAQERQGRGQETNKQTMTTMTTTTTTTTTPPTTTTTAARCRTHRPHRAAGRQGGGPGPGPRAGQRRRRPTASDAAAPTSVSRRPAARWRGHLAVPAGRLWVRWAYVDVAEGPHV